MRSSAVTDAHVEHTTDERSAPAEQPAPQPAELAVELERLRDRWLRARADLENYRKRSEQEVERRVGDVRDRLLLEWLEVVDSVDRALQLDQGRDVSDGLRAVLGQMEAVLARQGVTRVDAAGERFNPELHEALGARETDEVDPGHVADVARSGYLVGDRVLRPAQVIVARASAGRDEEEATG
jgi:molecular chaperone GrpE